MSLAGGFAEGDCVVSKIAFEHANGALAVGDVGTVNGPCNTLCPDASERVNCSFPNDSNINVHLIELRHAPFAGGFAKGDCVVSQIASNHANGALAVGDVGTVNGPCKNLCCPDATERVNCSFPNNSNIDVYLIELRHAPLAGGFAKGNHVVSKIAFEHANGTLAVGDVGTVNGPCKDLSCPDAYERVNCSFENCFNVDVHLIELRYCTSLIELRHAPLERTKVALLMLQVATDIDSLDAALQTAEGMASVGCELAAEMTLARERLERWKIAARAEAKARTIDEFDAHIEQIQLQAATPARVVPSTAGPSSQSADDGTLCVVCIDSERTHAFVPCGHNVCCGDCCTEIMAGTKECPVCRATCLMAVHIYR